MFATRDRGVRDRVPRGRTLTGVAEVSAAVRENLGRCLAERLKAFYHTALAILGQPDQAEDVVQETALRALGSLHTFRSEADICTWVHRILLNRCNDHLGSRKTMAAELSDEAIDGLWQDPNYSVDPAAVAAKLEDRRRLVDALGTLTPARRAVVVMHDSHGWKLHEIAEMLDIPLPTVKSHLRRGRQALITLLSEAFIPALFEPGRHFKWCSFVG